MANFTNANFTYANFTSTITSEQIQEYLDNPMFVPLIIMSWMFLITNHKYHKSFRAFKSFKTRSADEIFSLQVSMARDEHIPNTTTIVKRIKIPRVVANTEKSVFALSLPFSVISDAVVNYSQFHNTSITCVSLDDVLCSSAGIKGWATKTPVKKKPTEYNLFIKNAIADIKRDKPGIQHKLAFLQATKKWQSQKE